MHFDAILRGSKRCGASAGLITPRSMPGPAFPFISIEKTSPDLLPHHLRQPSLCVAHGQQLGDLGVDLKVLPLDLLLQRNINHF